MKLNKLNVKNVKKELEKVIDPELGVNIVELGLVYEIEVKKGREVKIVMTLTSPGCPFGDEFKETIKATLSKSFKIGKSAVEVEFVFEPVWSPKMMSKNTRIELGFE